MKKETIYFEDWRTSFLASRKDQFRVKKLVNSLRYRAAEFVPKDEVEALIKSGECDVIITEHVHK